MIDAAVREIKENLLRLCEEHTESDLTPASAEAITHAIEQSLSATGKAAFRVFLESKDEDKDMVVVDGEILRFKPFAVTTLCFSFSISEDLQSALHPLQKLWA